ncbi:hypothetical protein EVAR_87042_1 [Eumeta japonica]|uniref:Uncharacterized protein n=1 Tax=Eumeta variegata TaxID=151549 RepID=A0A4C1Z5M5_EUMVA|nr:hypothetical protein EVAR_87042_1 [Eumeta japonica]
MENTKCRPPYIASSTCQSLQCYGRNLAQSYSPFRIVYTLRLCWQLKDLVVYQGTDQPRQPHRAGVGVLRPQPLYPTREDHGRDASAAK